jgi:hypothetical protein
MDVSAYSIRMASSEADGAGEHPLRGATLSLDRRDSFSGRQGVDGGMFAARIVRPAYSSQEILLIPAGDEPLVFLLQDGTEIVWDPYMHA